MPLTLLFPGQNSRYPAMFEKLLTRDRSNIQWMERASDLLKRDLRRHYSESNTEMFAHNRDVQLGVFLANHMHWQNLERSGVTASYSAGLSLGEYNHLVHIGALDFEDALRVLDARGRAYEQGPPGKMTAVFPVSAEDVQLLISRLASGERLAIGMFNTPRQCVLSGDVAAVDEVALAAEDELLAETVVIEQRLPMHSPLFRSVGEQLRPALDAVAWRAPQKTYLPNLKGKFVREPTASFFVESLSQHTCNPVRWRETIETLAAESSEMTFVETGPGSVLSNFFGRKWISPSRFQTDAVTDFEKAMEKLTEELNSGSTRAAGPS